MKRTVFDQFFDRVLGELNVPPSWLKPSTRKAIANGAVLVVITKNMPHFPRTPIMFWLVEIKVK